MSVVTQRQSICWTGAPNSIKLLLDRIGGPNTVEVLDIDKKFKIFDCIELVFDGKIVIIEWQATPVSDMYADTVLASLLQSELCGDTIKGTTGTMKGDRMHFKECLIETLQVFLNISITFNCGLGFFNVFFLISTYRICLVRNQFLSYSKARV
jgi:cleavage and polyadenylation specificity factor subunit 3